MTQSVDYDKYLEFVDGTTSNPSKNTDEFIKRIKDLDASKIISRK